MVLQSLDRLSRKDPQHTEFQHRLRQLPENGAGHRYANNNKCFQQRFLCLANHHGFLSRQMEPYLPLSDATNLKRGLPSTQRNKLLQCHGRIMLCPHVFAVNEGRLAHLTSCLRLQAGISKSIAKERHMLSNPPLQHLINSSVFLIIYFVFSLCWSTLNLSGPGSGTVCCNRAATNSSRDQQGPTKVACNHFVFYISTLLLFSSYLYLPFCDGCRLCFRHSADSISHPASCNAGGRFSTFTAEAMQHHDTRSFISDTIFEASPSFRRISPEAVNINKPGHCK